MPGHRRQTHVQDSLGLLRQSRAAACQCRASGGVHSTLHRQSDASSEAKAGVLTRARRGNCVERGLKPDCRHECFNVSSTTTPDGKTCGFTNVVLSLAREDSDRLGTGPAVLRFQKAKLRSFDFTAPYIWDSLVPVLLGELNIGPKVHAMWRIQGARIGMVHVFERWDALSRRSSQALPGAVDDLIYRTRLYARAGLFHSDLKLSDILLRRRSNGEWETRLSDFDRTFQGIAISRPARHQSHPPQASVVTDGTLMAMTLLPMTLTFACNFTNRKLPISAQMAGAVHALSHNLTKPRRGDFIAKDFQVWKHKMIKARQVFALEGNVNDSVCARLHNVVRQWSPWYS